LLAVSSVADIAIASTLAVGGIAMTRLPALVVVGTLAAAAVFALVLDLVKVPVFARLGIAQSRPSTHEALGIEKTEGIPMTKPSVGQPKASDAKPEAKVEPKPEAKAEPKPDAKARAKPEAEPKPQANTGVAALLNTSLGDLLVAGLVKDPEDGGRIIAAAITQAKASIAVAKAPEAKAEPKPEAKAEPQPDTKAAPKTETEAAASSDATPQVAKPANE
jgi:hypothetical protein